MIVSCALGGLASASSGQAQDQAPVRAELRTDRAIVPVGRPIWVDFLVRNVSDEPMTLRLAGPPTDHAPEFMGLPLDHIFSDKERRGLSITNERARHVEGHLTFPPRKPSGPITVAPHTSVGRRLDLSRYYNALLRPGKYTLVWAPYDGILTSNKLKITVTALREAVIQTDYGRMSIRFDYEHAPHHVENFIELAKTGFYDNLTFHRIVPGGIIQGGCPRGNGTGVRPDGKRLKAEFSDVPCELGSVCMARAPKDPDSGSCQFFICLSRQPSFDGQQTVFGKLVGAESYETLRKIAAVETDARTERPIEPVRMRAVTVRDVTATSRLRGKRLGARRESRADRQRSSSTTAMSSPSTQQSEASTQPAKQKGDAAILGGRERAAPRSERVN